MSEKRRVRLYFYRDGVGAPGNYLPDSAEVDGRLELSLGDIFDEVVGEKSLVLEDAAVEIDDVESAVGAGVAVDGAEALVGGGEEVSVFVGVGGGENSILLADDHPLHEIGGWLGDEN